MLSIEQKDALVSILGEVNDLVANALEGSQWRDDLKMIQQHIMLVLDGEDVRLELVDGDGGKVEECVCCSNVATTHDAEGEPLCQTCKDLYVADYEAKMKRGECIFCSNKAIGIEEIGGYDLPVCNEHSYITAKG